MEAESVSHVDLKGHAGSAINGAANTFPFQSSNIRGLDSKWIIRLTSLEECISFFNITEELIEIELHADLLVSSHLQN